MVDTKALNEKLMKFCGIEYGKADKFVSLPSLWCYGYYLNGKRIRRTCPDLVHELDAQKKYIHPKLSHDEYELSLISGKINKTTNPLWTNTVSIFDIKRNIVFSDRNDNMALAFALAVEKLIDSMEIK
jgi:hypothetical protein